MPRCDPNQCSWGGERCGIFRTSIRCGYVEKEREIMHIVGAYVRADLLMVDTRSFLHESNTPTLIHYCRLIPEKIKPENLSRPNNADPTPSKCPCLSSGDDAQPVSNNQGNHTTGGSVSMQLQPWSRCP